MIHGWIVATLFPKPLATYCHLVPSKLKQWANTKPDIKSFIEGKTLQNMRPYVPEADINCKGK